MISQLKTFIRGIIGILEGLEKAERTQVESSVLAKSAGGLDINIYKLGNGSKKILFLGCVHGNEIGAYKLVYNLINYLDKNRSYLKNITVYFVPAMNVDGYNEAIRNPDYFNGGLIGRTNNNNVDLNRNFDTADWAKDGIWRFGNKEINVSGGERPFSEPETKALKEFIGENGINIIFDFHNRAGTVLGTKGPGKEIAKTYSKYSGYKDISDNNYPNTG